MTNTPLTLQTAAVMDFLPAVTKRVETAAGYYGLGKNEALKTAGGKCCA
jgi:hypothetical protein